MFEEHIKQLNKVKEYKQVMEKDDTPPVEMIAGVTSPQLKQDIAIQS